MFTKTKPLRSATGFPEWIEKSLSSQQRRIAFWVQMSGTRAGFAKKMSGLYNFNAREKSALIAQVENRPCLYNKADVNYKDNTYKDTNWQEIATSLGYTGILFILLYYRPFHCHVTH